MSRLTEALKTLLGKCTPEGTHPAGNNADEIVECLAGHFSGAKVEKIIDGEVELISVGDIFYILAIGHKGWDTSTSILVGDELARRVGGTFTLYGVVSDGVFDSYPALVSLMNGQLAISTEVTGTVWGTLVGAPVWKA